MAFGIGYPGSKSKIANEIISILPRGKRFVDLFGGGGAMTHCAALSGKYESVLYNDADPHVFGFIRDIFLGKYASDVFTPRWVTRQEFNEKKDVDGYVRFVWSFGNKGGEYFCAEAKEPLERAIFEFIINGTQSALLDDISPGYRDKGANNADERKRALRSAFIGRMQTEPLERLARCDAICRQVSYLGRSAHFCADLRTCAIVFENKSYDSYKFEDGDVVYCDPPYFGTEKYKGEFEFDFSVFWAWANTLPCFISEYSAPSARFKCINSRRVNSTLAANSNGLGRTERLFASPLAVQMYGI